MTETFQGQYLTATGEKIPSYLDGPWWLTKLVREGERFPKGHGYCWRYEYSFSAVSAPIPLNIVYGCWYRILLLLRRGIHGGEFTATAYDRGYADAYEKLRKDYYDYAQLRKAYHQGREHAFAIMWAEFQREDKERRERAYGGADSRTGEAS
jgi:hypothetical protein